MKVRLSADLRQKIEGAARQNNRTLNAEIVARLERSFREEGRVASPVPAQYQEKLDELEQLVLSGMFGPRWGAIEDRLSALEKRLRISP